MPTDKARNLARVVCVALVLSFVFLIVGPALAAGYPRRIAVAPFVSLAKEDIGQTVAVLPRLMASRLMALAGADVLILPADGKSPQEAAREAKYPLLLQGTVSKLGKGYSIDTTVTDLAEGKSAGAFFAAAATEDDIISQMGLLSGQIAEKIFGVQGAVQAVSPAPVAAVPATAAPAAAPAPVPAASPRKPSALTPDAGWEPSSIRKLGQSDKIADETYGIVALGREPDGSDLVAAYGRNTIHIYRVKGSEILFYTRYRKPLDHQILWIEAMDLDGDGVNEILVNNLIEESVQSYIMKRQGAGYVEVAEKIRYYMVVLPDWLGKRSLVGQYQGLDTPFRGKIVTLRWDGKGIVPGDPLPHNTSILPLSGGIVGLSSARFGQEWRLMVTDEQSYLRVLDEKGKSLYRSRSRYGSGMDFFEWGPIDQLEGRRKQYPLRKAVRLAPGSGKNPLILTTEIQTGIFDLSGDSYDSTRLVFLQWDGGNFLVKTGTPAETKFHSGADFLSGFGKGGRIVASVIEQTGTVLKDKISRLYLYQVD